MLRPHRDDRSLPRDQGLVAMRVRLTVHENTRAIMSRVNLRIFEESRSAVYPAGLVHLSEGDALYVFALPAGKYRLNGISINEAALPVGIQHLLFDVIPGRINYGGDYAIHVFRPGSGYKMEFTDESHATEAAVRSAYPATSAKYKFQVSTFEYQPE